MSRRPLPLCYYRARSPPLFSPSIPLQSLGALLYGTPLFLPSGLGKIIINTFLSSSIFVANIRIHTRGLFDFRTDCKPRASKSFSLHWDWTVCQRTIWLISVESLQEERVRGGYNTVQALYLNGGLDEDEMDGWCGQWEAAHNISLAPEMRVLIQATTGSVPSLLSSVLRAVKADGRFRREHLDSSQSSDIQTLLTKHVQSLVKDFPERPSDVGKVLVAALNNNKLMVDPQFTDRRFVYQDKDLRWRYTSLLAFEAIFQCTITLENWTRYFEAKEWVDCLPLVGRNPSMLGYAIEYAVTNILGARGLKLSNGLHIPPLQLHLLPPGGKPQPIVDPGIYVPLEFNHRYIDCVAVWFDHSGANIVPIQISNVSDITVHSDLGGKVFLQRRSQALAQCSQTGGSPDCVELRLDYQLYADSQGAGTPSKTWGCPKAPCLYCRPHSRQ
ncbi:hypothetical protein DFH07DRAFT_437646 [Mycena maculata]|uniref:Uncharacterized protein n=1 Tax=Mycena maculata TaxID=230809 RepID=A0AAD7KAN8_9AGAR|nr:hypothetical protein DFH07DRAFT_437646 [Mycena maculata]